MCTPKSASAFTSGPSFCLRGRAANGKSEVRSVVYITIAMMEKKAKKTTNPFKEFEWMGDMDNFDRQVEEELLEEDFIRTCIEQLLEEEEERETMTAAEIVAQQKMQNLQINGPIDQQVNQRPVLNGFNQTTAAYTNGYGSHNEYDNINIVLSKSKLNPNAKVFVPRSSS